MKKKKSLHLRKKRHRSQNKRPKFFAKTMLKAYNIILFKRRKLFKKLMYSLFLHFQCVGHSKILNFFTIIGITKTYRPQFYKKKSVKIKRLMKKHNKKNVISKNKSRLNNLVKILFVKKFKKFSGTKYIRINRIEKKKKMYLHFSYRHLLGLPVRGQRTKTNAKTRKDFNII